MNKIKKILLSPLYGIVACLMMIALIGAMSSIFWVPFAVLALCEKLHSIWPLAIGVILVLGIFGYSLQEKL